MWDNENLFSWKQALAAGDSTNVIDLGPGDGGKGEPVYLTVNTSTGSAGDLTVTVNTSDVETMAGAIAVASYTIPADKAAKGGDVLVADLPTGCKRFVRLAYAGAGISGTVTAGLNWGGQTNGM